MPWWAGMAVCGFYLEACHMAGVILHMETLVSSGDYNVLAMRHQGILLHADIQTFVLKGR